jgi:preprotein translocase SecE subunit
LVCKFLQKSFAFQRGNTYNIFTLFPSAFSHWLSTTLMAITHYFREALTELHRVTWPTRAKAVRISAIVLTFTFVAAAVMGAFDSALAYGYQQLLTLASTLSL